MWMIITQDTQIYYHHKHVTFLYNRQLDGVVTCDLPLTYHRLEISHIFYGSNQGVLEPVLILMYHLILLITWRDLHFFNVSCKFQTFKRK
jgi:hypothetical protein